MCGGFAFLAFQSARFDVRRSEKRDLLAKVEKQFFSKSRIRKKSRKSRHFWISAQKSGASENRGSASWSQKTGAAENGASFSERGPVLLFLEIVNFVHFFSHTCFFKFRWDRGLEQAVRKRSGEKPYAFYLTVLAFSSETRLTQQKLKKHVF